MKYTYDVVRKEPLDTLITIECPSSQVRSIRIIMNLYGVPEVGPGGGKGYIISEGEMSISGSYTACKEAADAVLRKLNGFPFRPTNEIYAEIKQGAMPV